ncbi:Ig-like domain-containing protein [Paenibacillus sp. V4I5]|uniref:Ig-like domain-containing protein n=1 Tax=Paenibacillus sp. V4I5 TaxID=3042306 RepID=UPI00278DEA5B|nr:Ig-like domain-containing protein [Paenibacillus sp. V4I5]MDQ0920260.1 alpha-tubulin suppressor-like RCC1 family protein [Paenibacillus sp. V4I5]
MRTGFTRKVLSIVIAIVIVMTMVIPVSAHPSISNEDGLTKHIQQVVANTSNSTATFGSTALLVDGSVYMLGGNGNSQLGNGTTGGASTVFTKVLTGAGTPLINITRIYQNSGTMYAWSQSDSKLYGWGRAYGGKLGVLGGTGATPTDVSYATELKFYGNKTLSELGISFDGSHEQTLGGIAGTEGTKPSTILAIATDGKVYSWGSSGSSNLALNDFRLGRDISVAEAVYTMNGSYSSVMPTQVIFNHADASERAIAVAGSDDVPNVNYILSQSGVLYAFGNGLTTSAAATFVTVEHPDKAAGRKFVKMSVSSGGIANLLDDQGYIYTVFNTGSSNNVYSAAARIATRPSAVYGNGTTGGINGNAASGISFRNVYTIGPTNNHVMFAIANDGTVYEWGSSTNGGATHGTRFGDGTAVSKDVSTAVPNPNLKDVEYMSMFRTTAAAVRGNVIYTWGFNAGVDQLGNGSGIGQTASQGTPRPINEEALVHIPALAAHVNDELPLAVSYSPANSATGVALTIAPSITFNKIVSLANGSSIADTVKVYKGTNNAGTLLAPSAYTVTNAGKVLTITFANALQELSDYYIEIQGGKLKDFKGTAIATQGSTFKTVGQLSAEPLPVHNATVVSIQIKPSITFTASLTSVTNLNTSVELHQGTFTGTLVQSTAAFENQNSVVRISPLSALAYNTDYYIVVKANAFKDPNNVLYPTTDMVYKFTTKAPPAFSSAVIKQAVTFSGSDADGNATALLTIDGKVYVNGNNANGIYANGSISMPNGGLTGVFRSAFTSTDVELSSIDRIYTSQGNLLYAWDEENNKLYAWGKNGFERSGIMNSAPSVQWATQSTFHNTPINFAGGRRSLSASVGSTFVIDKDGALWSWGQASAANAGNESNGWTNDYRLGRDLPGISVASGVLRPIWEAQAANGIKYLDAGKAWYSAKPGKVVFTSDPNEKAIEVTGAGTTSAVILTNYGNIYAFGGTGSNQFSSDPANRFAKVAHPVTGRKFVQISASVNGTAIMLDDLGQVYALFAGTFSNNKTNLAPQKPAAIYNAANGIPNAESLIFDDILAFGGGTNVTYMVKTSDGRVYVWGSNQSAKLGLGIADVSNTSVIPFATENTALKDVEGFYGINDTAIAWKGDVLYTWGSNPYNSLANGTNIADFSLSPLPITKPYLVNIPGLQAVAPDGDPPTAPDSALEGTNANFVYKPVVSQDINNNILVEDFMGWGGQYNHQLFSDLNRTVYDATNANLKSLEDKLVNLNPKYTRIFYDPDPQRAVPYVNNAAGGNSGYTALYGDLNFESLEKTLQLALDTHSAVNLTYWHPATELNGQVVASSDTSWDINTGMGRWAKQLKTLIVDKGFTNIKALTIYNEPNDGIPMDKYVQVYRALDIALKNEGIRDLVKIVGGDLLTGNQTAWFKLIGENLNDVVDEYSIHRYWFDGSTRYNMLLTVQAIINALPENQRKPVQITEFGPNKGYMNTAYSGSQANLIKYAYETSGFNIMSAALGFDGTSKWDIYHAKYDGDIQDHSMIRDARDGYELRPEYWAFLLQSMTSESGWNNVKVRSGTGDGGSSNKMVAALESPDGSEQSFFLLNQSITAATDMSVEGLDTSKTYYVYMWNENGDGKITEKGVLAPSGTASVQSSNAAGGVYKVTGIKGNSYAVLTTRQLDPSRWADVWEYDNTPDVFITPSNDTNGVSVQADVEIGFNVEFLNRDGIGDINKIDPTSTPQILEGPNFVGIVKVYKGTSNSGTALVEGTDFVVKFKTGAGYTYKDKKLVVSFPNELERNTDYYVEVQPNVLRHVRPAPTSIPYSFVNTMPVGSTFNTEAVLDASPPVLSLPENITAEATGPSGAAVSFRATATDIVDGSIAVACTQNSGSTFPLGITMVNCSAQDQAGNAATGSFTITVNGTLLSSKDSYLRQGSPNTNEGGNPNLTIQGSGNNRVLVGFDGLDQLSTVGLKSATLVLTIMDNSDNWGRNDVRTVDAHRLLVNWTEGNGSNDEVKQKVRGTGNGVTWNSPSDTDISNQNDDGNKWDMLNPGKVSKQGGKYADATAAGFSHYNDLSGKVTWDVTNDVKVGAGFGWLIKKTEEGASGKVIYYSREYATNHNNLDLAPRLILQYGP